MTHSDSLLGYIVFGDFGILTMTPAYLFGLLFPVITVFYFLSRCLEDSGLFARFAQLSDKPLSHIGLSGHTLLPMVMGFGCVTAALASLSSLENRKERFIASALLSIFIPCSAQTAIIFAMFFFLGPINFLLYLAVILSMFFLGAIFLNALLSPGRFRCAVYAAAPLQKPDFKLIFNASIKSGILFIKEAALPFIAGSIIISLCSYLNIFILLSEWLSPLTVDFLRLPKEAANFFILSIIKRDLGVAGLLSVIQSGSFTDAQLTVSLTVMTLFVPCFASAIILIKQEKLPAALFIWLGSFTVAIFAGKLVSLLLL